MNNHLLRLAAHCLFDGWIITPPKVNKQYRLGYANKSEVLIDQFMNDAKFLTGKIPYMRRRRTATEIEISNKKLFLRLLNFINLDKTIGHKFFEKALSDTKLARLILKAFWDDEGTVSFGGGARKLRGRCSNDKLRKQLLRLHKTLNVSVKEDYDKLGIIITGKENLLRFQKEINFTLGVRVLYGNRIRDTWTGRNKCDVLNIMLNTYQK